MRYYLDTNILIFILQKKYDDLSALVLEILKDYSNLFYTSSVAVKELILLHRIGKVKNRRYKTESKILSELKKSEIEIRFFNERHFSQYAELAIVEGHKDMNDHAIIAQAMSDKIPLISSDQVFKHYISQGLDFVFNKR
ncbi:MAG: PIN domain-containing protein [Tannerella sp.]|jgi:PIN domain nuclease of toxin-antitoxin system|nr:PIN domain-containing protein [Tannerella sp.]